MEAFSDLTRRFFVEQVSAFAWNVILKPANTIRASTVVVSTDPDLRFNLVSNGKYVFRLYAFYQTLAAADFKFRLMGPAIGTGFINIMQEVLGPGETTWQEDKILAYSTSDIPILGKSPAPAFGMLQLNGIIHNGPNAGAFEFHWAQNTSTAGATATQVMAGSYIEFRQVA